ncbi:MAG: formate dehydrogenase accessory protein FdhE [Steroidobacteraceae bacterium]|jgi:FdhE protein
MAQRILEPGEIETLAQRSIPRVRIPARTAVFARRAARLRHLGARAGIGDYLRFLAVLVDAQHATLQDLSVPVPTPAHIQGSTEHGMPPLQPAVWPRGDAWFETLRILGEALAAHADFPAAVAQTVSRIRRASRDWIEGQADALLQSGDEAVDAAAAPLVMASLQVHWAAYAASFAAEKVSPLDVPGVCPLCGTQPVASVVYAQPPYQGYRYLHCALCATEWHMVRVQCTRCGAVGKSIAYQSATLGANPENDGSAAQSAVRAETCEECHGYRKVLYQEKDPGVEPVADDLASLNLDLLLGERGYHRASGNPLLWQPDGN